MVIEHRERETILAEAVAIMGPINAERARVWKPQWVCISVIQAPRSA